MRSSEYRDVALAEEDELVALLVIEQVVQWRLVYSFRELLERIVEELEQRCKTKHNYE